MKFALFYDVTKVEKESPTILPFIQIIHVQYTFIPSSSSSSSLGTGIPILKRKRIKHYKSPLKSMVDLKKQTNDRAGARNKSKNKNKNKKHKNMQKSNRKSRSKNKIKNN